MNQRNNENIPVYEFHVAKQIRKKYEINESLFSLSGNLIIADFRFSRELSFKINANRARDKYVSAGLINAVGLLDEIIHYVLNKYSVELNPNVIKRAVESLRQEFRNENLDKLFLDFIEKYPPADVYQNRVSAPEYLKSFSAGRSNYEITLSEMILLHLDNFNPAADRLYELFDENYLKEKKLYRKFTSHLENFFQKEKKLGKHNQDLLSFFKTPMILNPHNLEKQLDFIKENWGIFLDERFLKRILSGKDLFKEDILIGSFGGDFTPTIVPKYKGIPDEADKFALGKSGYKYAEKSLSDYQEAEKFTLDKHWMPRVVLIAKNVYVWLDQLSKKYRRSIRTLDQIPDEELEQLANYNFTALWLIGIWERSRASKRIKHILGNIDAVSSAYSLYDYQIAADLGGETAYQNLHDRAFAKGIRLASDMVPNHTGIYSDWIINHPEYFIQTDKPPFPGYKFTGENLSENPNIEIRIEDGYWNKSDAAVVFQRIDKRFGDVRYIYHGNDGTNMPWNDTAQLDMLKKEVREAVIQKIFDVAKKFSIIRFDAAMTLAKKHFARLWYPEPGQGGDIPSRSDYEMTKEEFNKFFPKEFWREVVDRINEKMPETLLLAEAFWLMEGYFVRTLGMHRVYNSAFMHMMMKEENEKYRDLITNTLEFEPEILKRYVNFMSNPDEETAIKQFGIDDKYFGVLTMMVTLPGLPMFAHGQIEGYTEKYGMEYKRAYYNETPNDWLVERHKNEIFPLMKKRYLFSEVESFWFYDFIDNNGNINENVFAFSNSYRHEKALVLYNNRYERSSGYIKDSTSKLVKNSFDNDRKLKKLSLSEALSIQNSDTHFYICKELITNLEYLFSGKDLFDEGFLIELDGFKYNVFWGFYEVYDSTGKYRRLYDRLKGHGVIDINLALKELYFEPIHEAFVHLLDPELIKRVINAIIVDQQELQIEKKDLKFIFNRFYYLLNKIKDYEHLQVNIYPVELNFVEWLISIKELDRILRNYFNSTIKHNDVLLNKIILTSPLNNQKENTLLLLLMITSISIGKLYDVGANHFEKIIDKLMLDIPIFDILRHSGRGEVEYQKEFELLKILSSYDLGLFKFDTLKNGRRIYSNSQKSMVKKAKILLKLLNNDDVKKYINVNKYRNVWYYSKENFEELLKWFFTIDMIDFIKNLLCSKKVFKGKDMEIDEYLNNLEPVKIYKWSQTAIYSSLELFNYIVEKSIFSEYKLIELKKNLRK